jgi:PBSX family phage portal protein
MALSRKIRLSKKPAQERLAAQDPTVTGFHSPIGYTAGLQESLNVENISKNVYGIFDTNYNPHYSVVEGDILSESGGLRIIEPVYSYRDLLKVYYSSSILRQCVDSYRTNIEAYGLVVEYVGVEGQESSRAAQNEKMRLLRLLGTLTSDGRTLKQHREDSRVDYEVLGARCFEIQRDAAGRVVGFDHVPTSTIRMTNREKEYTPITYTDPVSGAVRNGYKRFCRFVQIDEYGKKTWFKEWGDPRMIDPTTGKVNNSLSIEEEATEIYYQSLYSPGTCYGVPRWVGALPSLLGAREAEMVNLNFFRDNAIPAMAVLVSGGALTEESFEKIKSYIDGVRGQKAMNRIVVLEAMADAGEMAALDGSLPAPRVDMKPMLSERQHEGLFKDYISDGSEKARSSFRLPPIYIGSAKDYNRASAFASMLTADEQIFQPERMSWDDMFHRVVLATHGLRFWRAKSTGPGIKDPQEVARIINSLGREGALTANIAIKIANRYLDADIEPVMDEWGDIPFSIVMQYVKAGKTIEGLDIFEETLEETVPPEDDEELDLRDANLPLQKSLRRLLDKVVHKMQDDLDEAVSNIEDRLQSIASTVE